MADLPVRLPRHEVEALRFRQVDAGFRPHLVDGAGGQDDEVFARDGIAGVRAQHPARGGIAAARGAWVRRSRTVPLSTTTAPGGKGFGSAR